MDVRLEPQGKHVKVSGRRRGGDRRAALGLLAGTVMVIRGEDLLTDDEMIEDVESVEIRAVISGGAS
jgi:hypothetical protein